MIRYQPPLRDMKFVLVELLDMERALAELPSHANVTWDLAATVLTASARFSQEVLLPTNVVGDTDGCRFENGRVTAPPGFREAYRAFRDAGWQAMVGDPTYGGQGLPHVLARPVEEMLNSANQAWAMYVSLTHGAYAAIEAHGSEEQKRIYLPELCRGAWTGTMCLTEPQCGTDLGLIRTHAEPDGEGGYRITGTKIFVSSGEHDLSENIIHLVLARLPNAPAGTRGLSLFVVPKLLPGDGNPSEANGVRCSGIEHKMGIHGNPTCTLHFEGARAWLLGEPHQGLKGMFVMMNGARLTVGIQSLGLSEVAYQSARGYAMERLQSRALSGVKAPKLPADPIIVHPDVRRMLLTQRAYTEGGRALACWIALMTDQSRHHPSAALRQECDGLVALLTPVAKAFLTDNGVTCTNLALQVFGGHGYIRDSGIEQLVRDARINPVYEGTNGIQAMDLLGRKVLLDQGVKLRLLGDCIRRFVEAEQHNPVVRDFTLPLAELLVNLEHVTQELAVRALADRDEVGAAAVDYLRLLGHLTYAYLWARMAKRASEQSLPADPFYSAKLATARFYFQRLLPETASLLLSIRSGAENLLTLPADAF